MCSKNHLSLQLFWTPCSTLCRRKSLSRLLSSDHPYGPPLPNFVRAKSCQLRPFSSFSNTRSWFWNSFQLVNLVQIWCHLSRSLSSVECQNFSFLPSSKLINILRRLTTRYLGLTLCQGSSRFWKKRIICLCESNVWRLFMISKKASTWIR